MFGLTGLEMRCLILCYCEGYSHQETAGFLGCARQKVSRAIESSKRQLKALGLPEPQPYGVHNREELRAACPQLFRRLHGGDTRVQDGALAAVTEP